MANKYHANTNTNLQTLTTRIMNAVGKECDFSKSPGFRLTLEVSNDGQTLTIEGQPLDQGFSNPFGTEVNGRNPGTAPIQIAGSSVVPPAAP